MTVNITSDQADALGHAHTEAAEEPVNDAHVTGFARQKLLVSLLVNNFVLLALYCGVLGVLLPNQIAAMDPANKATNLAIARAQNYLDFQHVQRRP